MKIHRILLMDEKNNISSRNGIPSLSNASQHAKTNLLPPLLLEYEEFVAALKQQVDFYKAEHTTLRNDLMELVTENRCLSDKLKEVLGNKLSRETVLSPRHKKKSDMVANLQQQLSLTAQEKDSAVEMWHMAVREVDNLEDELKAYQDNRHVDLGQKKIDDMKQDFSDAITMLESKLSSTRSNLSKEKAAREELQKNLEESIKENLNLTVTLESRQQELETALEGQCTTARKLQDIDKKSTELQEQVDTFKKAENDMELALARCHDVIDELVKKNMEARDKVSESLQLVECAIAEKDAAMFSGTQIREENVQLQKVMSAIVDEAGAKVKEEVEIVKQQYNKKLKVLLLDMRKLEDENIEKEKKLQKEIKEKCVLEGHLHRIEEETPLVRSTLQKKLSMVYNELADVKQRNLQLGIDKENIHSEMDKMKQSHAIETRKMNVEYKFMEEQMIGLQTLLETANRSKGETGEHVGKLANQINYLEQELERRHLMTKKELQDWQQHQYEYENQKLVTQIQEIEKKSNATATELEHHLEKQHIMKTKYQRAIKTMTEKFTKRIQDLRSEASTLRQEKKSLESRLSSLQHELAV